MTPIKSALLLTLLSSTLLAGTVIAEEHDVQKSEQAKQSTNQSTNQLPEVSAEDKKAQEAKATKQGKHEMLRTKFLSRRPYQGK